MLYRVTLYQGSTVVIYFSGLDANRENDMAMEKKTCLTVSMHSAKMLNFRVDNFCLFDQKFFFFWRQSVCQFSER